MKKIVVYGWNVGFKKVEFTKLLREEPGYTLSTAKLATDAVLEGQVIAVDVSEARCEAFCRRLTALGAKFKDNS